MRARVPRAVVGPIPRCCCFREQDRRRREEARACEVRETRNTLEKEGGCATQCTCSSDAFDRGRFRAVSERPWIVDVRFARSNEASGTRRARRWLMVTVVVMATLNGNGNGVVVFRVILGRKGASKNVLPWHAPAFTPRWIGERFYASGLPRNISEPASVRLPDFHRRSSLQPLPLATSRVSAESGHGTVPNVRADS